MMLPASMLAFNHATGGWCVADFGGLTGKEIATLAAIIIIILVVMNMRKRRPPDPTPRRPRSDATPDSRPATGLPRDIEHLMVQLEELSRGINAQIDTKFAKLEQSIADADKRITALRTLLDYPRSDAKSSRDVTPQEPRASVPTRSPGADDRFQAIYELADQGLSPVEIGRKLGRRTGEIELILNLRGTGDQSEGRGPGSALV